METWGTTLTDQRELLEIHTSNSITCFDKCVNFMKERIQIEEEYARSLQLLVKQYQYKKDDSTTMFTYQQSFNDFLQENINFAKQRDEIAKHMSANILNEMQVMSAECKETRKRAFRKLDDCKLQLDNFRKTLSSEKRKYDEATKEPKKTLTVLETASRMLFKQQFENNEDNPKVLVIAEKAKKDYEASINWYNHKQKKYYEDEMVEIIDNELQGDEEKRNRKFANFLHEYASIEQRFWPAISRSITGMINAAQNCDPAKDSITLIKHHLSGGSLPKKVDVAENTNRIRLENRYSLILEKGTKSISSKKKECYIAENDTVSNEGEKRIIESDTSIEYVHMSPADQVKKLKEKATNLDKELLQLENSIDGLIKMKEATTISGGDVAPIEQEICLKNIEISQNISLRRLYKNSIDLLLDNGDAESEEIKEKCSEKCRKEGSEGSEGSVGSVGSEGSSIGSIGSSVEDTLAHTEMCQLDIPPCSTESPPSPSPLSIFLSEEFLNESWYIVLYDFVQQQERELTVKVGDLVLLLDDDYGSGWSRVLRGVEEGYVPTSYIKLIYPG